MRDQNAVLVRPGGLQAYFVSNALDLADGAIKVGMVTALSEEVCAKVAVSSAVAEHMVDVHNDSVVYRHDSALLSTAWCDAAVLS